MAGTEVQSELKKEFEEKVKFGDEFPTTDELEKNKQRLIAKGRQLDSSHLLKTEEYEKNGKKVENPAIYSTKRSEPDKVLAKRYKTVMCRHAPNCTSGDRCLYAHSEEELALDICLDKYSEATAKGELEHHELCQNQQCPMRLRLLLKKTVICKYWEDDNKCTRSACSYAHGYSDRKPLPKFELCRKNKTDSCNLEHTECVYAHGEEELQLRYGGKKIKPAAYPSSEADTVDEDRNDHELSSSSVDEEGLQNTEQSIVLPVDTVDDDETDLSFSHHNQNQEVWIYRVSLCEPCQDLYNKLPQSLQKNYFTYAKEAH